MNPGLLSRKIFIKIMTKICKKRGLFSNTDHIGVGEGSRTHNLQVRSPVLYPIELHRPPINELLPVYQLSIPCQYDGLKIIY